LYIFQYTTNEAPAATLATAAVYLALRIIRDDRDTAGRYAILGLCLGVGLLTKVTAVLVVVVVLGVLGGRLLIRCRPPLVWLRTVGLAVVLLLGVSGWHYWRVYQHFGTPLLGNYDAASTWRWWQYPGYGTLAYLGHFGRVFISPYFSGFYGYGDGMYSTLW